MTRVHLGEFEQILLLALARFDEDASSLDVRGCIESRTGRAVSPGAIYTAFQRLERRGFVATGFGEPTPQRGGKRKKLYRLRPAGVRALQEMQAALGGLARGLKPRATSR